MINLWIAFSTTAIDEFKLRRSQGKYVYDGPMDERTYKIMRRMADGDNVRRFFKDATVGANTYSLFNIVDDISISLANQAVTYLTDTWSNHIIALGAWWYKSGLQIGTELTPVDPNADPIVYEVTGTPALPIHAQTWRLMPDVVEYDAGGAEISRTPATSNADLKDINLRYGQTKRRFV